MSTTVYTCFLCKSLFEPATEGSYADTDFLIALSDLNLQTGSMVLLCPSCAHTEKGASIIRANEAQRSAYNEELEWRNS